jgi:hypothetical protein
VEMEAFMVVTFGVDCSLMFDVVGLNSKSQVGTQ